MPNSWAAHARRVPAALPSPASPGGNSNPDRGELLRFTQRTLPLWRSVMSHPQSAARYETAAS